MIVIRQVETLTGVKPEQWDNLTDNSNPFLKYAFLAGLERFKCLDQHGWFPCHLLIEEDDQLVGALPLYLKTNSIGEFVFDWDWADAYEQAGGKYYPKLVSSIPFTPATGKRFLIKKKTNTGDIAGKLCTAALDFAGKLELSGVHILFPDNEDRNTLVEHDLLSRVGVQYHWFNHDYDDFEQFLSTLSAKKRKQIRRERRILDEENITIEILEGTAITDMHWSIFHEFYQSTFLRKWGEPRFTLDFLESLGSDMPESTLLIMARHRNEYVAGALLFRGSDTLYGRHWGCNMHFRFLHFELCYYQTIDYCIKNNLSKLDAGAQGEHKIKRGFIPVKTYSAHWIRNESFRKAINNYLVDENRAIQNYINELSLHLAYKAA